jgi:hypothetical protein
MIGRMKPHNLTLTNHSSVAPDAGLAAFGAGGVHAFFSIIRIIQGR